MQNIQFIWILQSTYSVCGILIRINLNECYVNLNVHIFFQIKYAGADADATIVSQSYCKQISKEEFEQTASSSLAPMAELLEGIIKDKELSIKDKKKKLKQVLQHFSLFQTGNHFMSS